MKRVQIPDCMIELHLHLDGSLSPRVMRELADMQEIPLSDEEIAHAGVTIDCRDLNEYLEKFALPCSLLQTREALELASYSLFMELKEEGCIYAEVRFAPQLHLEKGLTQEEAVEAVVYGMHKASLDFNMDGGIILCCMRGENTREANLETVEMAAAFAKEGVVAVDLAGAEALYPTEEYREIFEKAQEEHVTITLHAGEAAGPESIESALSMGASRIGHGVRCLESEETTEKLSLWNIPLELCPTSNLQTSIYDRYEDYPVRKLMEAGIPVTINSDNRTVSSTTLRKEYEALIEHCGLTEAELKVLMKNSAEAAFAPEAIKNMLRSYVEAAFR